MTICQSPWLYHAECCSAYVDNEFTRSVALGCDKTEEIGPANVQVKTIFEATAQVQAAFDAHIFYIYLFLQLCGGLHSLWNQRQSKPPNEEPLSDLPFTSHAIFVTDQCE